MYRKINIKVLSVLFAVLLAVVVLIEFADLKKGARTFKADLVEVETENVTSIELYPKISGHELIRLFRENEEWKVETEGKTYNADQAVPGDLIAELNGLKTQSVVATSDDRWDQFEVTDSLGTRVKLFNQDKLLADVIIGKFTFSQPRNMTSYVRLAEDDDVYGVEGMVGMSFNRDLKAFRNKTVIQSGSSDWTKLLFSYPADSSFVLEKVNEKWMVDDQPADSMSVVQFFNSITRLNEGRYADEVPSGTPTHLLSIEGSKEQPITVSGYYLDEENFIFESSMNAGTYFNNPELAEKVYPSKTRFIK